MRLPLSGKRSQREILVRKYDEPIIRYFSCKLITKLVMVLIREMQMQGQGFETSSVRFRHIQYLSKTFEIVYVGS